MHSQKHHSIIKQFSHQPAGDSIFVFESFTLRETTGPVLYISLEVKSLTAFSKHSIVTRQSKGLWFFRPIQKCSTPEAKYQSANNITLIPVKSEEKLYSFLLRTSIIG